MTRLVSRGQQAECCCLHEVDRAIYCWGGLDDVFRDTSRGTTEGNVDVAPQSEHGHNKCPENAFLKICNFSRRIVGTMRPTSVVSRDIAETNRYFIGAYGIIIFTPT